MNYTTIVTLSFCMLIILTLSVSWIICKTYEKDNISVSYTHLRAHETLMNLVCRPLLEKIFLAKAPDSQ